MKLNNLVVFRCTEIYTPEGDMDCSIRITPINPDKIKLEVDRVLIDRVLSDGTRVHVYLFKEESTFKMYIPQRYIERKKK